MGNMNYEVFLGMNEGGLMNGRQNERPLPISVIDIQGASEGS